MNRRTVGIFVAAGSLCLACRSRLPASNGPDGGLAPPVNDAGTGDGGAADGGATDSGVYGRAFTTNPIIVENQKTGSSDWRAGSRWDLTSVQLYTSNDSVEAGQTVAVLVSTDGPMQVDADVYRLGDYGGLGARRVWSQLSIPTDRQPACPRDPATSLVECHWPDAFSFAIAPDWISGIYLVKVARPDGQRAFAPFVVRDHRAADVLYQPAFNTNQAYNEFQGEDLYADVSGTMPGGKAFQVSYDRPFVEGDGAGHVLRYDWPMASLLERYGYDVTYGTNLDFSRFDDFLHGIGAMVHAGHDEYWTAEERAQVDAALAGGQTSLAYFGANGGYWRARALPGSSGSSLRTLACYKSYPEQDPVPYSTIRFRDPPNAHPENALFGVMYSDWETTAYSLVVKDPNHWLFAGTGLAQGTRLPGLVGNEFDRTVNNGFSPPGLSVSLESPVVSAEGIADISQTVDRTLPSGRLVFAAGTIDWPVGLDSTQELYDSRLEQMTLNVLERSLSHRHLPRNLSPSRHAFPIEPPPVAVWAHSVDAVSGAGRNGFADGPSAAAQFNGPTALAVSDAGQVFVADTGNNKIRMIDVDPARTVSTVAGTGDPGSSDGSGATALFRRPNGLALAPDGAIYVADSNNQVIRRIAHNPPAWTVSTYAGVTRVSGFADGPSAVALFNMPTAVAANAQGDLFVADQGNSVIRMISAATGRVTTLAGNGIAGYLDAASGVSAQFDNPSAIALASDGAVYVVDSGNANIRRIGAGAAHPVTTLVGRDMAWAGFADGTGDQARIRPQMGLLAMPDGSLLLADTANFRLRRIIPGADAATTRVVTVAGNGNLGTQLGTGDVSNLVAPAGLALGPGGRVYVTDSFNALIRAVTF